MDSSATCLCKLDKSDRIECIECIRKANPEPYFLQRIGKFIGFKIPPIEAEDYSCPDPKRFIYDEERKNIIGLREKIDISRPCWLKCNHCELETDLNLLLVDYSIGRNDEAGNYLMNKRHAEIVNSLKKKEGNGEIVFYENEDEYGFSVKNYHNRFCMRGGHCHCMFDRIPMRTFRFNVLMAEANGKWAKVHKMVREFYTVTHKPPAAEP